ncbi:hypothetical protein CY0110_17357 [Crocosphaera chwakensis CCY0110]|uniref:Uncharacterized protein n=1 Tax=Crocosphaera chwakensis CCY0110 TaxID=391612 RepID=A3IIF3_9CHRO|nr:hypothetical protein CY0110_17357 [Crocosphaera chwakensis CCY0110]
MQVRTKTKRCCIISYLIILIKSNKELFFFKILM